VGCATGDTNEPQTTAEGVPEERIASWIAPKRAVLLVKCRIGGSSDTNGTPRWLGKPCRQLFVAIASGDCMYICRYAATARGYRLLCCGNEDLLVEALELEF
jgi:hypothetical protein